MDPNDYCLSRIGGPGTSLYYSLRHLPPGPRAAVTALHALARELADIPLECHDPALARTKLAWWRDQIGRAAQGRADHPVMAALAPLLHDGRVSPAALDALAVAAGSDLPPVRFRDAAALETHARRTAGQLALLVAATLGATAEQQTRAAELGAAHALARALIEAGADIRHDRLYFSAADLARSGITESDLLAARETDAWLQFIALQHAQLLDRYAAARRAVSAPDLAVLLPELVMAELNEALLAEIRAAGYHVLSQRIALTPLRRLWIAWRARQRLRWSKRGSRLG